MYNTQLTFDSPIFSTCMRIALLSDPPFPSHWRVTLTKLEMLLTISIELTLKTVEAVDTSLALFTITAMSGDAKRDPVFAVTLAG